MISFDDYYRIKGLSKEVGLDQLHQRILSIYKEVKKICDKHNLRYFAEGGTWVGAALCEGFIPWDDDMDLRMPRKDYELFIKIAPKELPEHLQLIDCTSDPYSAGNMLKVHDITTTFVETTKRTSPDQWTGVFVDITPFDYAPNEESTRERLRKVGVKLFIYSLLRKKNHVIFDLGNFRNTGWYELYTTNGLKPPRTKLSVILLSIYIYLHRISYFSKKLDRLWRGFTSDTDWIVCPERPWEKGGKILYLPRAYYSTSIEMKFCDTVMPVPVGYKEISLLSYGFEPTLNVSEDLKYKHLKDAIVDLEKSYKWYVNETLSLG